MRFRSGTLERSLRRWGPRMPRPSAIKRKQFAWQYVVSDNTALGSGGGTTDIVLFDNTDWHSTASPENVRNVSLDLRIGVVWTPTANATNTFNSSALRAGIFVLDQEDTGQTAATVFADTRALWWDQIAMNLGTFPTASPFTAPDRTARQVNWRVKKRQRFLRLDEELRLLVAWTGTTTDDVIADARLFIFGRISFEIP